MRRGYGFPTSASDGALPSAAMAAPCESFWKPGGWWEGSWWDGGKKKRRECWVGVLENV